MIKFRYTYPDGSYVEHPSVTDHLPEHQSNLQEITYPDNENNVVVPYQTTLAKFRIAFKEVTGVAIETIVDQIKLLPDSASKYRMIQLLEYSNTIERHNQTLIAGAQSNNISAEILDQIFITAETLNY